MKTIISFCLTLIIFIGSAGVSKSADFQDGMWAYIANDYATALREFKPLAEQGHPDAQYYMGVMYAFGKGVQKDHVFAHMWANIALLNGYQKGTKLINIVEKEMTPSQIKTAQDLTRECVRKEYEGCGGTKSVDASASVLLEKALNAFDSALSNEEYAKVLPMFRSLSEKGNAAAQFYLGFYFYWQGNGVKQDLVYAYMWMKIADINGENTAATYLHELEQEMTPSQLETAKKLAPKCVRKNYKGC